MMTAKTSHLPSWAPNIEPARWVDNRVYTEQSAYDLEVERIFHQTWLFAEHASAVRKPGDFVTTTLAGEPILIVRDEEERVRAFYNTCRHRGSKVVAEPCGHASALRCPYHFWSYDLSGRLIGVPGEEAYAGTGFSKEAFPLLELRVETLLDLIFVSFNQQVEPLRDFLGPEIVERLSTPLANGRYEVIKQHAFELPINWKIFAENVRDGYHVPFVHPFFRKASPPGSYYTYRNGHAVQELGMDPAGVEPEIWAKIIQHTLPGVKTGDGYIVTFFPDATITLRSNVISINTQRSLGAKRVVLENRVLGLAGDSPAVREIRELGHATWFLNPVELEDAPIFVAQQEGLESSGVRYSLIARGASATTGTRGDDNRLRGWWSAWRAMMGVEINSLEDAHD